MNDEFFGAHHLLFDVIHLATRLSHLAHVVLRYLTLRTQGFDIIYWEIWAFVSHHFIHILPLAYIMVRVVRPLWGHEISCLLWRGSFGQALSTDWVWDVDRSPLLRGISRVTYCLSIQFACLRSMIRDRWYKELGSLRAPLLDVLTHSY